MFAWASIESVGRSAARARTVAALEAHPEADLVAGLRTALPGDARSAAALGSSAHTPSAHAYSDALLLKMMSDLNAPAAHARQSASMAAVRLVNGGAVVDPDLNPAAAAPPPPHVVPCNSPVNTRKPAGKPASPQRDREHIQHIVYVPSGQTAKVRLIKG